MTRKAITIYVYEKCSTCKQALRFLQENGIDFEKKEITQTPPTPLEIKKMLGYVSHNLKKVFNTSGMLYRELELSIKLPNMPLEEAIALLASNGMLVKRPFLLGDNFGCVGFSQADWEKILL